MTRHPAVFEVQPFAGHLAEGPSQVFELDEFELDELGSDDELRRAGRGMPLRGPMRRFAPPPVRARNKPRSALTNRSPVSGTRRRYFGAFNAIPGSGMRRGARYRRLGFPLPVAPAWAAHAWAAPAPADGLRDADWQACVQGCMRGRNTALSAPPEPFDAAPARDADQDAGDGDAVGTSDAGEGQEFEFLPLAKDIVNTLARRVQAADIIDLTAQADKTVRKGKRDTRQVDTLVLHQMACCARRKNPLHSYLKIASHFVILADGRILQMHPIDRNVWASHGFNATSVAVEFAGNFPDVRGRWWRGDTFGKDRPTPEQINAGRQLVRHLQRTMGLRKVVTHRQSYGLKENDPGPEIWHGVGQWAVDQLGLSDGGPGYKIGKGSPIPDSWRKPPARAQQELDAADFEWGEFEQDEFESDAFEVPDAHEVGNPPGRFTLQAAIADRRANGPGLYAIFKNGQRLYVGKSHELRRRLQEHLACLTRFQVDTRPYTVQLTPLPGKRQALGGFEGDTQAHWRPKLPLSNRRFEKPNAQRAMRRRV